jgi:L,D-peptidoglycan transpeptidase YkuD (ErfK/YbiS/YcfS/YnhG family)
VRFRALSIALIAVFLTSCKTPPVPPEVGLAATQEQDLWRAGASFFSPEDFRAYGEEIRQARAAFDRENLKLGWFRRYDLIQSRFRKALGSGDSLLSRTRKDKEEKAGRVRAESAAIQRRIDVLNDLTVSLNERGPARRFLSRAEVMLREAALKSAQARNDAGLAELERARQVVKEAEAACMRLLSRYNDPKQLAAWRALADETIRESRTKEITALVISKLEKKMYVYRNGVMTSEYDVGLGINGLADKLHSGDDATPEGRYQVTKKMPASQYYRAFLINYPNDEDRKRFANAKQRREIPYWVGIGGRIEIHGGGTEALTKGCVSVDDKIMDRLFEIVSVGTPVTIVGTLNRDSDVFRVIRDE